MPATPVDELLHLIALQHIAGLGPVRLSRLLSAFDSVDKLLGAAPDQLQAAQLPQVVIERFFAYARAPLRSDLRQRAMRDVEWLDAHEGSVVTLRDQDYPPLLREIDSAPALLYVMGDRSCLGIPHVAMVGSRNPTGTGKETAHEFAAALSRSGVCVTSGMALGIDAASHAGALSQGGPTVAVWATGLDCVYPPAHRALAQTIAVQGAIVSELPLGSQPRRAHFPRRNRLISGLSTGVLVVEAALDSGSLITARYGLEQGREIFAIPGSIHNPLSKGCHQLIRSGAKLVETVDHIFEELTGNILATISSPGSPPQPVAQQPLEEELQELLSHIGFESTSVDVIASRCDHSVATILPLLIELELRGAVVQRAGGYMRDRQA